MTSCVVCVPVTIGGDVGHSWGKAPRVAVARVAGGTIESWDEQDVAWDVSHDTGEHGTHHARIVRFLREHDVTDVLADHMGDPMVTTLGKLGVRVRLGVHGDAREACLAVCA